MDWRAINGSETIAYDLEIKNYNDLVRRKREREQQNACFPLVLVLLALPREESRWLQIVEDKTVLEHCCYWYAVDTTEPSENAHRWCISHALNYSRQAPYRNSCCR